jgi:IS30 family transposase
MIKSSNEKLNSKEWLEDEFINKKKLVGYIAKELGVHRSSVNRALKRHGLYERRFRSKYPELDSKEWLVKELETKSYAQIAREIGCHPGNVADRVKRYGIEYASSKSEAIKKSLAKRYPGGRWGENSSNWRGGKHQVGDYIMITQPKHPRATSGNRVFEHILVAEKTIGRYLSPNEVVHHKNGDKLDNRPENLEVLTRAQHIAMHQTSGKNIKIMSEELNRYRQKLIDRGIALD